MHITITKENYEQVTNILDALPSAMIVLQDDRIKYVNLAATRLRQNVEGEYLSNILKSKVKLAKERLYKIQFENAQTIPTEYEIITNSGESRFVEAMAYPIDYMGATAVLVVASDITERKRDILNTSIEQRKQFQVISVKANSMLIDSLYQPAKDIGGDFYFFHTINEKELIGVIGDVSGKGTLAAMLISSFEVLFHEAVVENDSFYDIIRFINDRLIKYFKERYVAALFFKISEESLEFISCGINKFVTVTKNNRFESELIEGAFLGMFPSSLNLFGTKRMFRHSLKQLILFTDGMEAINIKDMLYESFREDRSSSEVICELNHRIDQVRCQEGYLKDDVALLCIDLDFYGTLNKYVINHLTQIKELSRQVTEAFQPRDAFNVKLIINELVTNAFKYGNAGNADLPIGIKTIVKDDLFIIKVTDMAIKPKDFEIITTWKDEDLLAEHGRGLYILNSFCKKICFDNFSVVAEYLMGGKE